MIVAGFGFTTTAKVQSLTSALAATGYAKEVQAVATLEDKAGTVFESFAAQIGVQILPIPQDVAQKVKTVSTSVPSQTTRNIASVAEATALAAAGPSGRLVTARHISEDRLATCAIAIGDDI